MKSKSGRILTCLGCTQTLKLRKALVNLLMICDSLNVYAIQCDIRGSCNCYLNHMQFNSSIATKIPVSSLALTNDRLEMLYLYQVHSLSKYFCM